MFQTANTIYLDSVSRNYKNAHKMPESGGLSILTNENPTVILPCDFNKGG
jgi:hypothetical protein